MGVGSSLTSLSESSRLAWRWSAKKERADEVDPMGLSNEAKPGGDLDTGIERLAVNDGGGDREGVEGSFNGIGNRFAILLCYAWDGGGAIGGDYDVSLVKVEVAADALAKAVEFLQEEQDIFYIDCCSTVVDVS